MIRGISFLVITLCLTQIGLANNEAVCSTARANLDSAYDNIEATLAEQENLFLGTMSPDFINRLQDLQSRGCETDLREQQVYREYLELQREFSDEILQSSNRMQASQFNVEMEAYSPNINRTQEDERRLEEAMNSDDPIDGIWISGISTIKITRTVVYNGANISVSRIIDPCISNRLRIDVETNNNFYTGNNAAMDEVIMSKGEMTKLLPRSCDPNAIDFGDMAGFLPEGPNLENAVQASRIFELSGITGGSAAANGNGGTIIALPSFTLDDI